MKRLLVTILVLTLSMVAFATHRYSVKNYCTDEATWKHWSQSTLDDSGKHADCGAHSTRDFAVTVTEEHEGSVKSRYDPTGGLPGDPATGDSYICTATANGWTIHYIYLHNGSAWEEEIPHEGQECWIDDVNHGYVYRDGAWEKSLDTPLDGNLPRWVMPAGNGALPLLGWYEQTDSAESLTFATPVTASVPGYHSHFVIDVSSSVGHPYTIVATGTSVDEATGTETGSDTENISVTGNGHYQTAKSWIDAVQFTITEGESCTIDIYRTSYWDRANRNLTATGVRMEWTPEAATWSIRLQIQKVANDGSISTIDDVTFANTDTPPRADNGEVGKYKRGNYDTPIEGSANEGIIIIVDQIAIESFSVDFRYNK